MKQIVVFLLSFVFLSLFQGVCVKVSSAADRIKVSVSVLPQAYFVERVGGDRVEVQVMIPPGATPATYEPTPRQMVRLSEARLYIKVGVVTFPFEKKHFSSFIKRNREMVVVSMSDGVKYRSFLFKKGTQDPHVWVAPSTVKVAAYNIYRALTQIDPTGKDYYKENLDLFLADIESLDHEIERILSTRRGSAFMVFHPAWGYFADQYGLMQLPIELGGKSPSASHVKKMIDSAREKHIKVIFIQKGFDTKSAKAVADEIGGGVIEIDPLEKDWIKNMKKIAGVFNQVLE
ncbi:MAG: zinc ABC transporter substrate-binding protein [Desulfatiglans sp.]|jgi:zinc transport system substrate-binding protein|nr:zinc ABC transporter substrate-binding protein [Thermodesulfobacteriota bacterium]MEE4354210.1 zinc ABC transporter substrate-binding protein [Desulfatiglans sp.]